MRYREPVNVSHRCAMWFQYDPVDDAEAPGSRECHSFDARLSTGLMYLFGGNDQQQRMNAILTLNTGA